MARVGQCGAGILLFIFAVFVRDGKLHQCHVKCQGTSGIFMLFRLIRMPHFSLGILNTGHQVMDAYVGRMLLELETAGKARAPYRVCMGHS